MNLLKKIAKSPIFIGLLLSLSFAILHVKGNKVLESFELKTLDFKFNARGPLPVTDKVCIVTVDEKTYQIMGRWPYPRSVMADMITKLNTYGAKIIGFDAMFTASDRTGSHLLKDLLYKYDSFNPKYKNQETINLINKYYKQSNTDKKFASALKKAENVILGYSWFSPEENMNKNYDFNKEYDAISSSALMMVTQSSNSHKFIPSGDENGLVVNIPLIQSASDMHAYFNARPDNDGLFRKVDLISYFHGSYFPSLSLLAAAKYLDSEIFLSLDSYGVNILSILDKVIIPTNQYGQLLVNFRGEKQTIPHFSLVDVLDESNSILKHQKVMGVQKNIIVSKIDAFKDKVIIFGVTAKGVYDLRNTPFEKDFPGVEVHGNTIDTIIKGDFIRAGTTELEGLVFIFILLSGLIVSYLLTKFSALSGFLLTMSLFFLYTYIDITYIFSKGILVTLFLPLLQLLVIYIVITLYKFVSEERQKKQIKGAFQQYVSSSIVNEMLKDPKKLKLGGESKVLTVLFSDVRGFTSISEKLKAQELAEFLNKYLTPMTDLIIKNKGTIDKYMGDAIMAFYGAPLSYVDHGDWACVSAIEMMSELKRLQISWESEGLPFVDIGIGINTGIMNVGNMGSTQIFDYTVMGDSVNLGSRVEGLNKQYGTNIIITEFTKEIITKNKFIYREIDRVKVKGKNEPVKLFELIDYFDSKSVYNNEDYLSKYNLAFSKFHEMKFSEALNIFNECYKAIETDKVSKLYISRCEEYIKNPPNSNWDGVVTMTTK